MLEESADCAATNQGISERRSDVDEKDPRNIHIRLADNGRMETTQVDFAEIAEAVRIARKAYEFGARGESLFGQTLCGDPGLNIILDLFLATVAGDRLCVSSACIGSRVAMTTALRYLALLRQAGYVDRIADVSDGRRHYIVLTCDGWHKALVMLSPKPFN